MDVRVSGGLALIFALGCARPEAGPKAVAPPAQPAEVVATASAPSAEPEPVVESTSGVRVLLTDPEALQRVEEHGYDLASLAFGVAAPGRSNNEQLAQIPGYAALVDTLKVDLSNLRQIDPSLGIGMRFAHRAFDPSWLVSKHFHYELVGIVNRMDRRPFDESTCGEIRFVYRAAYAVELSGQAVTSRVPLTLNVVRWLSPHDGDCREHARAWRLGEARGEALAEALLKPGGLLASLNEHSRFKSIEVNLQSARWPSTVRPNMAGHAEYLLRVFAPGNGGSLVPQALENTPDGSLMDRPNALRAEFVQLLSEPDNLQRIDQGTFVLPTKFLANRALSVAPHGLARGGNRPFEQILNDSDFEAVDLSGHASFDTPAELIRRLDGLSCAGCHQTHSVAGFHLLGEEPAGRKLDALAVAHSAHLSDELERRSEFVRAVLSNQAPDPVRPSVERLRPGVYAAHCGLQSDGPFSEWTCADGLVCTAVDDERVGQCLPPTPRVGDACETGVLKTVANSHRDAVRLSPARACDVGVCEANAVGFPGGMCSSRCDSLGEHGTCGAIAVLAGFNACLARQVPFETCIQENTRPGALRRCSDSQACREDYVCARLPSGEGGCMPPYFLFQLRIDGHVIP